MKYSKNFNNVYVLGVLLLGVIGLALNDYFFIKDINELSMLSSGIIVGSMFFLSAFNIIKNNERKARLGAYLIIGLGLLIVYKGISTYFKVIG